MHPCPTILVRNYTLGCVRVRSQTPRKGSASALSDLDDTAHDVTSPHKSTIFHSIQYYTKKKSLRQQTFSSWFTYTHNRCNSYTNDARKPKFISQQKNKTNFYSTKHIRFISNYRKSRCPRGGIVVPWIHGPFTASRWLSSVWRLNSQRRQRHHIYFVSGRGK